MPQRKRLFAINGNPEFEVPVTFNSEINLSEIRLSGESDVFKINTVSDILKLVFGNTSIIEFNSSNVLIRHNLTLGDEFSQGTKNIYAAKGILGTNDFLGANTQSNFFVNGGSLASTADSTVNIANFVYRTGNEAGLGIRAKRLENGSDWTTAAIEFIRIIDNSLFSFLSFSRNGVGIFESDPTACFQVTDYGYSTVSKVYSNQSSNASKKLLHIHNDHTSATGAIPLEITNDAVISTNFKYSHKINGFTFYTSDGPSPNGTLTGVAGDRCYTPTATFICAGGTSWS